MKAVTLYRPAVVENGLTGFDRVMDSLFGNSFLGNSFMNSDSFLNPRERIFSRIPAVDLRETEKSYLLEADLPGMDEKNIEIHLDGNTLSIESKKEEEKKEDKNGYMIQERWHTNFSRSFTLPENADREAISASFKNGVLCVEIGKLPEAQKRLIEISKN
jgi:HSP20 family protein